MQTIGKYEYSTDKAHMLGKGSFSEVYLGKYIGSDDIIQYGTPVAIKIIKISNLTTSAKKIINDEIEIMEFIKNDPHPNIVECYDIINTSNSVNIIMEYCDSGSLKTILKKPIKEKYIKFYFKQLINGLKYLNSKAIVHRDIKPGNILLTENKKLLKVADFGFAKKTNKTTLYDTICGSPLYMAPEMIGHDQYNNQTDLWSIGMILYEMLFGFHPYDSCRTIPDLKNIINTTELEIPPKDTKNKDVSEECLSLLNKLLQKDVDNRISWTEFFNHKWLKDNNKNNTVIISSPNMTSLKSSPINIIQNYYGDNANNSIPDLELDEDKDQDIQDQDECLFTMELGTSVNSTYLIKDIIDKNTRLDKTDPESVCYKIIN